MYLGRVKRIWYLSPMRAAKVQARLHIRAVSPEPPLLAHTSSESRGTFRQKARSLVPLNGWACAIKICHDGMLEDTNSLDGAQLTYSHRQQVSEHWRQISEIDKVGIWWDFRDSFPYSFIKNIWVTSWENLFLPYANNNGADQPFTFAQSDQHLCCLLPR